MADAAEAHPSTETLAGLRDRHLDLLEQWNAEQAEALAPQAEALRADAQALGGWLDEPDERDRAQGIIDYWTAALTGLPGRPFPDMLRLAPFDPALPAGEVTRAEGILAPHAGTPLQAEVEEMLLCLVRPGPHGAVICRAPVERAELVAAGAEGGEAAHAARKAELLDHLVAAGILRASSDPSGGEPRYGFAHGSSARAWARLRELVDASRKMHANINRLRATAQLWKQSGDAGFLLFGDALDEAGKYLGHDDTLNAFIAASRRAAERRRKQLLAIVIGVLFIAILVTAAAFRVGNWFGTEEGIDTAELKQEEIVQPDSPPPDVGARAALDEGGPNLAGWVWAGSDAQPQLVDMETDRPVLPSALAVDGRYRAGTFLWLRAGPPDARNVSAQRVSVVPEQGLVIVREAPTTVRRASGLQYWVRVGVVPAVEVRYANARQDQVARLNGAVVGRSNSASAGREIEISSTQAARQARNLREVRYFRPEHGRIAASVAGRLAASFSAADGSPIAIACVRDKDANFERINLEVRFDFAGVRTSPPRRRATAPQCV